MKICTLCGIEKELSEFRKTKKSYSARCKACLVLVVMKYQKAHKDKINAYRAEWLRNKRKKEKQEQEINQTKSRPSYKLRYSYPFTPYQGRVPVSKLKLIPRDQDGNQLFLDQLLNMTTLSDYHIRLIQKEMAFRGSIYEELARLLLRHRKPSELGYNKEEFH